MTHVPDWLAALAIVVPPLAGIVGYWLAGRNEENRDRRTAERERIARRAARLDRAEDQRHEFQRELLLELQDALRRFMRATAKTVMQDRKTLIEKGEVFRLPADIDAESYDAGVDYGRLRVRVLDGRLRNELENLHNEATRLELTTTDLSGQPSERAIEALDARYLELSMSMVRVNEILGEILRFELGRNPEEDSPHSAPERRILPP